MAHWNRTGKTLVPTTQAEVLKELPVGTYNIAATPAGLYLEEIENMEIPGKLYGNVGNRADRVISTFHDRPNNTGVLLTGNKGSGKTLLAKLISKDLREKHGISTLLVQQPYSGDAFFSFLNCIEQPVMLLFDEYEKVYGNGPYGNLPGQAAGQKQNSLLTLFDGTIAGPKRMFIATLNDQWQLNDFFKNRPGRFYYRFDYGTMEETFIKEYSEENLLDKKRVEEIVSLSHLYKDFNFDILKAVVEEMNRYGESAKDVVRYLNATPLSDKATFKIKDVKFKKDDKVVADHDKHTTNVNPLFDRVYFCVNVRGDNEEVWVQATAKDILKYTKERIAYESDGVLFTLEREKDTDVFDYSKLL